VIRDTGNLHIRTNLQWSWQPSYRSPCCVEIGKRYFFGHLVLPATSIPHFSAVALMPPKASTSSSSSSQLITPALSIQEYLKLLTSGSLTSLQAVTASQKLYKSYKNLESLSQLSQNDLVETHGLDESIAKGILELTSKGKGKKGKGKAASGKKRKVDQGADESMIKPPREVIESEFTFDEYEVEEALYAKSVVINRSPCMVAWAFIVCERLGFTRSESLSIAHV
jgi:hypothetical protein